MGDLLAAQFVCVGFHSLIGMMGWRPCEAWADKRLRRGNKFLQKKFFFAKGVKNLSPGRQFHLSFIIYN
jgi:hypothetical protein